MRAVRIILAAVLVLCVAGGCGKSPSLERELVQLCEKYTQLFAAKDYDSARHYLTGQALVELDASRPLLEAVRAVETKVSEFQGKVDFMSRDKSRASARCSWVQEQTVPGSGTTITRVEVVYDLVKLKGKWLISGIKLLLQEAK